MQSNVIVATINELLNLFLVHSEVVHQEVLLISAPLSVQAFSILLERVCNSQTAITGHHLGVLA